MSVGPNLIVTLDFIISNNLFSMVIDVTRFIKGFLVNYEFQWNYFDCKTVFLGEVQISSKLILQQAFTCFDSIKKML